MMEIIAHLYGTMQTVLVSRKKLFAMVLAFANSANIRRCNALSVALNMK